MINNQPVFNSPTHMAYLSAAARAVKDPDSIGVNAE